ncbi:AAA family ATPase [Clostridium sp. PL3]|uniref:AAA family ATPase n=1 Tax=Clostridium thailandense TaxID=2794346 RepID=A0A949X0S3_9CLOT|nr:AAA family ATPase [Clostridium thailandense]MBV7271474.1 AAA family ATPase [Clostridium thailandense]
MKISEVYIKNFRGYGENPKDSEGYYRFVDLDRYKFIIFSGYNGFGKTSFFDAIEWCLTDNLSRIEDKEKILMKSNLKKSHYLKFLNNTEKDKNREVEVCLKFDNGTKVIRKTKCSSLDENKYESEFTDGEKNILNKNQLNKIFFENKKLKVENLLNTNFLGQENINRILRAKSPSDRTEEFMNLLGLSTLHEIVEKSKSNSSLSLIIRKSKEKLENIKKDKKQLEDQFTANGWGQFDEYSNNVKSIVEKLIKAKENFKYLDKLKFKYLDKEYKTINEYADFIDNSVVSKESLINQRNKSISNLQILTEKFLISKIFIKGKKVADMKAIKDIDIRNLINKESTNEKILELYIKYYEEMDSKSKKLIVEKNNIVDINLKNNQKLEDSIFNNVINRYKNIMKLIEEYNCFIKGNYINECAKCIVRINKLMKKNDTYIKNIERLSQKINEEKNIIDGLSNMSDSYKKILNKIKIYLEENKDEDIKCCPICLNKDFTETFKQLNVQSDKDESIKNQLIKIINITVQSGNENIEEHQKVIAKKKQEIDNLKDIYNNKIYKITEKYVDESKACFEKIIDIACENVTKSLNRRVKHKKYYEDVIKKNNELKNIYEKAYKNIFGEEINYENINVVNNEDIMKEKNIYDKMLENYSQKFNKYNSKIEELNKRLAEIKEELKNSDDSDIKKLNEKIKEINNTIELMNEIEKYKFSEVNKKILNSFLNESKNEKDLNDELQKYTDYQNDMNIINGRASKLQESKLKELMQSNVSIQWIYDKISPHPYFKKLEFKYESGSGGTKMTNIVSQENENMYLDHIFSSAQLNVLALSIFLGLSMNQNSVKFNQLYLDDPIQSMDDINILSFIDLMRCFIDSDDFKNDIILSTHDSNFAKLLMIKMRNKKYKIINFESYGSEGPIIQ